MQTMPPVPVVAPGPSNKQKDEYYRFNKAFKEMLKMLISMYPKSTELELAKHGYKLVKFVNQKLPQILFDQTIVQPHEEYIMDEDDSFFVDPAFGLPEDYSAVYRFLVPKLKEMWLQCTEGDRVRVWNSIKNLVVLCKQCRKAD